MQFSANLRKSGRPDNKFTIAAKGYEVNWRMLPKGAFY